MAPHVAAISFASKRTRSVALSYMPWFIGTCERRAISPSGSKRRNAEIRDVARARREVPLFEILGLDPRLCPAVLSAPRHLRCNA